MNLENISNLRNKVLGNKVWYRAMNLENILVYRNKVLRFGMSNLY